MMKFSRTFRGFTLIELMMTITVLAILTAIAIPSFENITMRNRVSAATTELMAALDFARSEAITRGTAVMLKAKGTTCDTQTPWKGGWQIGIAKLDAGTWKMVASDVLRDHEAFNDKVNAYATSCSTSAEAPGVVFTRQGEVPRISPGTIVITAEGCVAGQKGMQRIITISATGHTKVESKDIDSTNEADC